MQVLLSFGPWIAFWVIAPFNRIAGAFSALGVCAAVNAYRLACRRGKILDMGTLAFFIFLSAISFSVSEAWMDRWAFVIANFALLAIILVSLAVRRPFTLQFAREQVPREHWEQPLFISINTVIAWVWAAAMAGLAAASLLRAVLIDQVPKWVTWAAAAAFLGSAILFTRGYPDRRLKRESGMTMEELQAAVEAAEGREGPVET